MTEPTIEDTAKFIKQMRTLLEALANQRIDGDILPNGEEYYADGNDDEVDALYDFVGWARELMWGGEEP